MYSHQTNRKKKNLSTLENDRSEKKKLSLFIENVHQSFLSWKEICDILH